MRTVTASRGRGVQQSIDARICYEPSLADDHDMSGGGGHLAHQMARDQDGAALPGEVDHEVADPHDPVRVQPVDGFVEDQHLRVAEQRSGEAEALTHAEREAPRSASRRPREANEPQNLVYPAGIQVIALR